MQYQIVNNADGPIGLFTLDGRIDALNSRQLREQFDRCIKRTNRFVFDCKALEFIDSSGLGTIVGCLREALSAGGDIRLAALTVKVKMVFELTQAKKLFTVFADADEALASFSVKPS